jgi:8-oxo-dGTP pyrophosphatase MutT (NUDIX family)
VVVIDQHDDRYSVLMVQRNPALRFYGGYWVFPGGAIDLADGRFETDAAAQAGCRELREEAGLRVAPADLAYWARWITPSGFPKRFDTRFYVAKRPADQQPRVIDGEVTALSWLPLASWPSLREGGDFPVPFATQFVLRELAEELERHGSLAALLAIATTRPILTILPKMLSDEVSVLPWDPDYDTLSGDGITWSAEQVAARDHWPSRG